MAIDLNCDMGEGFGAYALGSDAAIISHITSANLACGFHASDPLVMEAAIALCREHGVALGAHPGYPDLRGFGRRQMDCPPRQVRADIIYQVGALDGLARSQGLTLQHVKPHGALYNTAQAEEQTARAVCQALADYDPELILVTLAGPGGETIRQVAAELGLKRVAQEAFADRAYTPQGRLVSRDQPGAVIRDPELVAQRCLGIARAGVVPAVDGSLVLLRPHTICLHGDTPGAVELAQAIRDLLARHQVAVKPLGQIL